MRGGNFSIYGNFLSKKFSHSPIFIASLLLNSHSRMLYPWHEIGVHVYSYILDLTLATTESCIAILCEAIKKNEPCRKIEPNKDIHPLCSLLTASDGFFNHIISKSFHHCLVDMLRCNQSMDWHQSE